MTCSKCKRDAFVQRQNKYYADKVTLKLEPGEGHDGCKGCTCQHLPVGSVEFLGSNPSRSV